MSDEDRERSGASTSTLYGLRHGFERIGMGMSYVMPVVLVVFGAVIGYVFWQHPGQWPKLLWGAGLFGTVFALISLTALFADDLTQHRKHLWWALPGMWCAGFVYVAGFAVLEVHPQVGLWLYVLYYLTLPAAGALFFTAYVLGRIERFIERKQRERAEKC